MGPARAFANFSIALLLLCAHCGPSPRVEARVTPAHVACVTDVWIVSWDADYDGEEHQDEVITAADAHDRIQGCEFADWIRAWLDNASPTAVQQPETPKPGDPSDMTGDIRLVARVTSSKGTDVLALASSCEWVRRNRTQTVKFGPALLEHLDASLNACARKELAGAQQFKECAFRHQPSFEGKTTCPAK